DDDSGVRQCFLGSPDSPALSMMGLGPVHPFCALQNAHGLQPCGSLLPRPQNGQRRKTPGISAQSISLLNLRFNNGPFEMSPASRTLLSTSASLSVSLLFLR